MANIIELLVPDIGDFSDVPVIEIPVKAGDTLAADDTILVLESDKATLDVPAGISGRITELRIAVGDTVSQGSLIAMFEVEAAPGSTPSPAISGAGTPDLAPQPATATPEPTTTTTMGTSAMAARAPDRPTHASPAIRKLARELGAAIDGVPGTGPHGRITRDDLMRHVKRRLTEAPRSQGGLAAGADLPLWPTVDFEKFGPVERVPLSRIRRISGPNLARNAIVIPHVTNFDEADITETEAFRKAANAEAPEAARMTVLAFAVRACVSALKRYPAFNASLDGQDMVIKHYYHIGVAADTPDGLVVPVLRDADRKNLREIAAEMTDLAAQARAGRLPPQAMQGATFTISSLGGIGGTNFTPIINAPEVAILGMTRASIQPKWDGAAFQPRLIQPLSLSWDHRVVDGVAAAHFLVHMREILSDFRRISL